MIIFVSDAFVEHYKGGGELTTQAIIDASYFPVNRILSSKVSVEVMEKHKNSYWIFGNFSGLSRECLLYAIKNLDYSIIEFDYKFCKLRSVKKHIAFEGSCECQNDIHGKLIATFFAKSKTNFWMSKNQFTKYKDLFPFLKEDKNIVLSSVFDKNTVNFITSLDTSNKNDKWIILDSPSWIKGKEETVKYAKENNLEYELVWNLGYTDLLKKLASSKGLLFMPLGADTCPRLTIEAKLLNCELILNEDVQHKDEPWFENRETILEYLSTRGSFFWKRIEVLAKENLNLNTLESLLDTKFKIIVPFYNAEDWIQKCVNSLKNQNYKNFECHMIDDISTDASLELVKEAVEGDERFKIVKNKKKNYALKNIYEAIKSSNCADDDVIILLDGDDWLASSHTLSTLANVYDSSNCWMTYGSYVYNPHGVRGVEPSKYPQEIVQNNSFREDTWRASHLRSFKYKVWKKLKAKDLKDNNGSFYKMAYDQAIMLPLLEMCGERAEYVSETLYVYNKQNPLNVDKIKAQEQFKTAQEIRKKEKYDRLK